MSTDAIHPLLAAGSADAQRVRQLALHARWAAEVYASLPRERIAAITQAVAQGIAEHAEALTRTTIEETRQGVAADAARLIRGSTQVELSSLGFQKTGGAAWITRPVGVVALMLPDRSPVANIVRYAMFCLASGNAVLLATESRDGEVGRAVQLICRLAVEAGAPPGLVQSAEGSHLGVTFAMAEGLIDTLIGDPTAHSVVYVDRMADVALAAGRVVNSVSFNNGLLWNKLGIVFVHAAAASRLRDALTAAGARWCEREDVERLRQALFSDGKFDPRCAGQPSRAIAKKAGVKPFSPSKILAVSLAFAGADEPLSEVLPCPVIGVRVVPSRDAALRASRARAGNDTRHLALIYYGDDIRQAADFGASIDAGRVLFNLPAELGAYDWQTDAMPEWLVRRIPVIGPSAEGKAVREIALERSGLPA